MIVANLLFIINRTVNLLKAGGAIGVCIPHQNGDTGNASYQIAHKIR